MAILGPGRADMPEAFPATVGMPAGRLRLAVAGAFPASRRSVA